jgi:propionyl-CoA carboxylase alpha chain
VYADADADAPFVREADESIRLSRGYLDGPEMVEAALATAADAVHPGYGFLSENAAFARQVVDAGITWVGPSPAVIEAMGDKLAAKAAAVGVGVATLQFSDDPTAQQKLDYPVLVKAVGGGGGKGMRIVESADELTEAVATGQREALAAFGDDRVFIETYVRRARHIEIQIVGDSFGNIQHLGERECSIQRRHQKVVEESPSPVVDADLRAAMGDAAIRLAQSIGYESVGTVEFLLNNETKEFYFLEMNTRLQVEHAVTEEVTGVDLVALQIAIADGAPVAPLQSAVGHAIEARLYAEDPAAGFLPAAGDLVAFEPVTGDGVRWEAGVEAGSTVGVEFDPMLAKVIARGGTRSEAARRLAFALEGLHVGGVTTNRDFLVATLRNRAFLDGDTTTDFIERVRPVPLHYNADGAALIGALWSQGRNRADATVLPTMPSGWRNTRLPFQHVRLSHAGTRIDVRYRARRDGSFILGDGRVARVHAWSPTGLDVEVGGRRSAHRVTFAGSGLHVQVSTGTVSFEVVPRFELSATRGPVGGLVAPMPGVVLDVRCAVGDRVVAGQPLVVLEAMKMEHHVVAPDDGVVAALHVEAGEQVKNGAVLLVLDPVEEEVSP